LVANVSNLTSQLIDNKNIDPYILSDEEFKRKLTKEVTTPIDDYDVQVVEVVNVEDDTGPFSKIEQEEMKIESISQVTKEL
jgi:alkyl hydroperoxide reductase subunit AhpF